MKALWQEIRGKVVELSKLDRQNRLVFGSDVHKFKINAVVRDKDISAFEEEHGIHLPENYRTYLQNFGSGGAGPDYGIFQFPDAVWPGNLSKPLQLDFSERMVDVEESEGPLFDLDGMIRIGSSGGMQNYLIVAGPLKGYVICWNRMDMYCISGPFDRWYQRWLESIFLGLDENELLKTVQIGMHLDEIQSIPTLNIEYRFNNGILYFKYTRWSIKLNADKRVEELCFDTTPLGNGGHMAWSETRQAYL